MKKLSLILLFALFLSACGDAEENDDEEQNFDDEISAQEEACLHILEGPFAVSNATLEVDESAGNINRAHHAYTVSLVENTDGDYQGAVIYDASASDTYGIFTNIDVEVAVYTEEQESLPVVTTVVDECIEVARQHTVEMQEGRHFIFFGPTTDGEVSVVVEELADFE